MEYIDGRLLSRDDMKDTKIIQNLMQTVRTLHNYSGKERAGLPKQTHVGTIEDVYNRYVKEGVVFPSCFDTLYRKLQNKFCSLATEYTPSHGDLNPKNILLSKDGTIYLIDWAEAGIDSPFADIGWLSCFTAVNHNEVKKLLNDYLGREPNDIEMEETLFFRNTTAFLFATFWMGRQGERDQQKLDTLLESSSGRVADFPEKDTDLTLFALGWLKEFIENFDS